MIIIDFQNFQNRVKEDRISCESARINLKNNKKISANNKRNKDQLLREISKNNRQQNETLADINNLDKKLNVSIREDKAAYEKTVKTQWAGLNEFLQFTNPIDNIKNMQDDCPILLFPLRLETRFKKVESKGEIVDELWVRVFPDDISINSFESDFSNSELRNIKSYWKSRWAAGKNVDENKAAWRSLASAHGPGRAFWLIKNYQPANLSDEPQKVEGEIVLAIGTELPLIDPELGAITAYWEKIWRANKDAVQITQAWNELLAIVGEERATDLLDNYLPVNINQQPAAGISYEEMEVRVVFVIFPEINELETKLQGWSQPPTSHILPERFVFMAYQDDVPIEPQLGNLIPPRLILGPDPAAEPGQDFRLVDEEDEFESDGGAEPTEGDLIFSENMKWMFDFDEAVAKGMGFKISLSPQQAENGFDRVFVLGLKLSADKKNGQALLEDLFEQHQSSRKGMSIIKQGTPTNNLEDEASGYSWRHDPDDSFDIYFVDSSSKSDPADWYRKKDGRWLAEYLGISRDSLRNIDNYYATDISDSKAMQQALWPATMGHFMDSMMNPVFNKTVIEQTRDFFTRYVSGRGNIPAIRIGMQPYGILPTTNYTSMEWIKPRKNTTGVASFVPEYDENANFLYSLYRILLDMDETWSDLQDQVSYVGKEGDAQQILLDVIGLHPDSVELKQRYADTFKQIDNYLNINIFSFIGFIFGKNKNKDTSHAAATQLLKKYGITFNDEKSKPEIFKKVFHSQSFHLGGERIDKVQNSEDTKISIYTEDDKNYIEWLIEAAEDSHDSLRQQKGFIDDTPPNAILYSLLHYSLDLSYLDTSIQLQNNREIISELEMQQAYIEPDFINIQDNVETESRYKYLYKFIPDITGSNDIMMEKFIATNIYSLDEAAAFRDVIAGLKHLKNVPTAKLERIMMEHLDTVSYRYDAWILGYLHKQLEQMRELKEEYYYDEQPKQGIYLGAYGWLEDLRPENKILTPVTLDEALNKTLNPNGDLVEDNTNAGYIFAPSLNHAVTAAVLRNGNISSNNAEDSEELKIKLSSQRVRQALLIIEGIQGGQTLSSLLGYQFERGLHDNTSAEMDQFIFKLRNAFPLVAKRFKDTSPSIDDTEYESIEQIEAKNVLDGVAFLEHIKEIGVKTYPFNLNLPPFNLVMPPADSDQFAAMSQQLLKLIETNDAVADLALAESVHQVVLGNYERAAATLDTYSKGNFPPTPDVIKTPRSGTLLTHRVALQFRSGLSFTLNDPMKTVTPRMVAEPAIEDWLNQIMPAMDKIECVVSYSNRGDTSAPEVTINMQDLKIEHIDLIYLFNIESDQMMSALDDLIVQFVISNYTPRLDQDINIEYTRKLNIENFTVFEITSLVASLRGLLLKSKTLNAADVKLSNEAKKQNELSQNLNSDRMQQIVSALTDFRNNDLEPYVSNLTTLIEAGDISVIVSEIDMLITGISNLFIQASSFGMPQTGIGFVYKWQQSLYLQRNKIMDEIILRWKRYLSEYVLIIEKYNQGVIDAISSQELIVMLSKAELKVSSTSTLIASMNHADYFILVEEKFSQFDDFFNTKILPVNEVYGIKILIETMQALAVEIANFDIIGIDVAEQLKQLVIFADDLKIGSENLSLEINNRLVKSTDMLASIAGTGDPLAKVELVKTTAKIIFGEDFVVVPEFLLDEQHKFEWQNSLSSSDESLRYLKTDLDIDFPMDDWLYGMSRVREKLYQVENIILHIEGFNGSVPSLTPAQFPYRDEDFWLGMQVPENKPGSSEPYTIDEDKLLFTSIYSEPFDPDKPQCGLLLDEWTEVIPSRNETLGLSFHYDQPNSEPPQSLLLVTPSQFTGSWEWNDLVKSLHETLDMAKKRAVEPDQVDTTQYSLFLPATVSVSSPRPVTATADFSNNNRVSK